MLNFRNQQLQGREERNEIELGEENRIRRRERKGRIKREIFHKKKTQKNVLKLLPTKKII